MDFIKHSIVDEVTQSIISAPKLKLCQQKLSVASLVECGLVLVLKKEWGVVNYKI